MHVLKTALVELVGLGQLLRVNVDAELHRLLVIVVDTDQVLQERVAH